MKNLIAVLLLSFACGCSFVATVADNAADFRVIAVAQAAAHKVIRNDGYRAVKVINSISEIRTAVIALQSVTFADLSLLVNDQIAEHVKDRGNQILLQAVLQSIQLELSDDITNEDGALSDEQLIRLDTLYNAIEAAAYEYVEAK